MSGSIIKPNVIQPKSELVTLLGKNHFLSQTSIWDYVESISSGGLSTEEKIIEIKIVFLLNIIMQHRNGDSALPLDLLYNLFGTPPQYIPAKFDKWWTFEYVDIKNCNKYESVLTDCKTEDLSLLGMSGVDAFDHEMKVLYEYKLQQRHKIQPDIELMSHYVIQPKSELVAVLDTEHFLTSIYVWEKFEDTLTFTSPEVEARIIHERNIEMKMVFLLNIIVQQRRGECFLSLNMLRDIFGDPPQYIASTFDKWWTIELINPKNHKAHHFVFRDCNSDDLNLLGKSGLDELDSRLKMAYEDKRQHELSN